MQESELRPGLDRALRCALCLSPANAETVMEAPESHGARAGNGDLFRLVRCRVCGLLYLDPRPSPELLRSYYGRGYYRERGIKAAAERALARLSARLKRRLMERYCGSGALLDVGCGDGGFIAALGNGRGWDAHGVEPSPEGCRLAKGRGLKVFEGDLAGCAFPDGRFDVVTMWHVLEHATEPVGLLREARRVLRAGGVLVLGLPNAGGAGFRVGGSRWFHLDAPRHLFHFDERTAALAVEKAGFRLLKVAHPVVEYPLDLYHSLMNSLGSRALRAALAAPALAATLALKPALSALRASETMVLVCGKDGNDGS